MMEGAPHPPALLQRYQNKGVGNWAVRICMKTKKIARGKKRQNRGSKARAVRNLLKIGGARKRGIAGAALGLSAVILADCHFGTLPQMNQFVQEKLGKS